MREPGTLLIFTLLLNYISCTTLDRKLFNFDYSALQNINFSSVLSVLNPLTFTELAALNGYIAKSYDVVTEDGYILTLFHIPGNRPSLPVLLFHGLMDSADTWIIRDETSLAVTLAKQNYDVWLGNVRGNRYSRRHKYLDPNVDAAFWNFTFDEHGLYDLSATIDFVLKKTGAPKLNMFGHSQGTVIMWVLLSTRTEYNKKINVATALAPVCYLQYIQPPLGTLIRLAPALYPILQTLGVTNVFGDNSKETFAIRALSQIPVFGYMVIGYGFFFALSGEDNTELEASFLTTVTAHSPTWTSVKNLIHFAQVGLSNVFGRFDYGEAGNRATYNSLSPPLYNLTKVTTKVALLASMNDKLAPLANVERLRRQLPNVVRYVINPRPMMNHIDFIWGRTASDYLYGYIFDILENY